MRESFHIMEFENEQDYQDRRKLRMATLIVAKFPLETVRKTSLANLDRWIKNGVWVSAFEEWRLLLAEGTDAELLAVMIGLDENANRLRQSAPLSLIHI